MPLVMVTFHDGELLYAQTPELTFDLPVIEAEVRNVDSNSERAILPLTAIRQILVDEITAAPAPDLLESWDRAAFHFSDGQVLRARIGPDAMLGRHGGMWRLVEQGSDELRTLAIPYTSLKGVFQLRKWDGRSSAERTAGDDDGAHLDHVVRVLAEREARATVRRRPRRASTALSDRLRDAADSSTD